MRLPHVAVAASVALVALGATLAGSRFPSSAQETSAVGAHWPGAGLFGRGAVHTGTAPKYTVYAQKRDKPGAIEIHEDDTDIIVIMSGAATFVTGGTPIERRQLRPREWTASSVDNGVTREVARGDVFIVPKGTIHWFKDVRGSVSYYAVKVHEPDAPAAEPAGARIWTRAEAFAGQSPTLYDGKQTHKYQLFAVRRDKPGVAEVHDKETDIVFVLDGSGTWIVDGLPAAGGTLTGGTPRRLVADDGALVPPGAQHWFKDAQQLAYYAIKVY